MAARNYFIGIGGTGARTAEALIHLCAAGLGPKEGFFLLLVDPDGGNGNLKRTKDLLSHYRSAQSAGNRMLGDFFRTEIRTGTGDQGFHWGVVKDNESLGTYIELGALETQKPELAHLAKVLFTKAELETSLNEGFRGHPAIGAAIIASAFAASSSKEPWSSFWADVEKVATAGDAKVFLAGSIFGGTGAAGVPTFGKWNLLKGNPTATEGMSPGQSKIRLGGCLVLPYFSFTSAARQEQKLHVVPADFPLATRAALNYYYDMKENLTFDELYLLGDSLKQGVGEFSAGASTQKNRPHYVELVAALSARDFWKNAGSAPAGKSYLLAAREEQRFSLDSLPVTRSQGELADEQKRLRFQLVAMTLFSFATAKYLVREFGRGDMRSHAWYRATIKDLKKSELEAIAAHVNNQTTPKEIATIGHFGEDFLRWMAATSEGGDVPLVNAGALLNQHSGSWDEAPLREAETRLVIGQVSGESRATFDTFTDALVREWTPVGDTGAGRLLSRFATKSLDFADATMNVMRAPEER